jgi:electron-transferring-flavoprotein dehydrogenase
VRPVDVLIAGAGPAGLAAAIRMKQQALQAGRDISVVVIDKAFRSGYHNVSGAAVEPACLDELLPGWRTERSRLTDHIVPIERDELFVLLARAALRVPPAVVPKHMRHTGDVAVSVSRLVDFLAGQAERLGVEIYQGFSIRRLLIDRDVVKGVTLSEVGLDAGGGRKPNHRPAEDVPARITIIADGSRGVLSTQFAQTFGGGGANPQVYSLGIKAVVQFGADNPFGNNRVVHTIGYPDPGVFGGGFIYSMGERTAAVGLILGLDWKYGDLSPRREFERFRSHPFVERLLRGSVTVATGAKTIPEGGFFALNRLSAAGALVVGDAAGFVNVEKLKGVHYAVLSGMCAADAALDALAAGDVGADALSSYRDRLARRGILRELRHARNYRQSFRWGLLAGAPLSQVQSLLPARLGMAEDRLATRRHARLARPDPGRMDGATFVSLTGTSHREDEPSHVSLVDPARCRDCAAEFATPCTYFCPGEVYRSSGDGIVLSPSNCVHCMTCTVKCPHDNIRWVPPEGGEGPHFKQM